MQVQRCLWTYEPLWLHGLLLTWLQRWPWAVRRPLGAVNAVAEIADKARCLASGDDGCASH
jgi:hypothetical protein